MSQENVEIVRRSYEALDRRDWSELHDLIDPDFEGDLSRNIFNPDVYRGFAGIERWLGGVEDMWEDFHVVPTELTDVGDNVIAAVTVSGKGKESGVEVQMRLFAVWTLRNLKVVRTIGGLRDRAEALEAAGLSA
jgi:ketosteroid isomerase-like protein